MKILTSCILLFLASCHGRGEMRLGEVNLAGKSSAKFCLQLATQAGESSKDVLLGFTNCKGGAKIILQNKSSGDYRISYSFAEKGVKETNTKLLKPLETMKFDVEIADIIGFSIDGFNQERSNIELVVEFEKTQPTDSAVSARIVWADGP